MAWRGPTWEQGVYYSSYDYNTNSWLQQQQMQGAVSRYGPSLAEYGEKLRMAWRGTGYEGGTGGGPEDQGIYFSSYDGNTWTPQQTIQGIGSWTSPALAKYSGKLHMAWRGAWTERTDDQSIYYSSYDYNSDAWTPQEKIQGIGSYWGPSLGKYGDRLYMAWRGVWDWGTNSEDDGIWYSFMQ